MMCDDIGGETSGGLTEPIFGAVGWCGMPRGLCGSDWRGDGAGRVVSGVLAHGSRRPHATGCSRAVQFPSWFPQVPELVSGLHDFTLGSAFSSLCSWVLSVSPQKTQRSCFSCLLCVIVSSEPQGHVGRAAGASSPQPC